MTDQPAPALRILISAESVADAPRALQLLPVLAGDSAAMFGGLLVVDQVLANPQAFAERRIVTPSGQLVATPDAQRLQRIVECETRAFRKMLAEIADAAGAEWSAEVRSGTLGASLAAVANAWDIVVVGHRLLHQRQGKVVVLGNTAQIDSDVVAVASRMATKLDTDLVRILLPAGQDLRPDWFADKLDRLNASAVVLDAISTPLDGFRQLAPLLMVARCPIVILRSAHVQPQLEHSVQITPPPKRGS